MKPLFVLLLINALSSTLTLAWAATPKLILKAAEPESNHSVTILGPFQVEKVEVPNQAPTYYGTGTIQVDAWESLVVVKEQKGASLKVDPSSDTRYQVRALLLEQNTSFEVVRVLADGRIQTLFLEFTYPDFPTDTPSTKIVKGGKGPTNLYVTPGLSYSSVSYHDGRLPEPLSLKTISFKLTNLYVIDPTWDVSTSVYYTALILSSSNQDTVRFFGANLRGGYKLKINHPNWAVNLGGGFFYTTMIVPTGGYGFNDVVGPMLVPNVKYLLPKDQTISYYFKAALITGGSEFATGLGYSTVLPNGHTVSGQLDFSKIELLIESVRMISRSVSIGVSYTL